MGSANSPTMSFHEEKNPNGREKPKLIVSAFPIQYFANLTNQALWAEWLVQKIM